VSKENVELILAGFRRFSDGDETWLELVHPEVE
jgi:hypothetical protein